MGFSCDKRLYLIGDDFSFPTEKNEDLDNFCITLEKIFSLDNISIILTSYEKDYLTISDDKFIGMNTDSPKGIPLVSIDFLDNFQQLEIPSKTLYIVERKPFICSSSSNFYVPYNEIIVNGCISLEILKDFLFKRFFNKELIVNNIYPIIHTENELSKYEVIKFADELEFYMLGEMK